MGEPLGYPQLFFVLSRNEFPYPLAAGRRSLTNVYGNIKHFSNDDSYQFSLRLLYLIMQATQDMAHGIGVVILDEGGLPADSFLKSFTIEAFKKKAPLVRKHLRLDQHYIRNG
jgi:hypothetical protein